MKKAFKIGLIIIIVIYIGLYISYKNGYYVKQNKENMLLTEEKIKEYENDLKNGVDVSKKNYLDIKDNYDNSYTRLSLKISNYIESIIDHAMKYIFKKIGNAINE